MRKGILGSLAVLAGASVAFGQMKSPTAMPSGMYNGPVQPAGGMQAAPEAMQPPMAMGGGPGMAGPGMAGPGMAGPGMAGPMMGDPSGGMMPGGMPMYPPPGTYGSNPYADSGAGGSGGAVPKWWFNGEYLLWFTKSQNVNQPYVTTSAPGDFGVPGAPTTQLLYSTTDQGYGLYSGFRLMGGWYKDADRRCGFEFGGMLSENKTNIYTASSDQNGVPVLSRPFNMAGGGTGVYVVSNLGLAAGAVTIGTTSRFYGAEGNYVSNLYRSCPDAACFWNTDMLIGFRFFQLREDLNFDTSSTIIGGGATFVGQPVVAGGTINVHDSFQSWNQFYGGNLGLRTNINYGRCVIGLSGKIAFGLMHQSVDVYGSTNLTDVSQGINATANGGVYATSQNIGNYKNDEFAILPEVGLNLGYHWCSWFSTYVGYNALWTDKVARPGNAVPYAVNPALMPSSNNFGIGAVVPVQNTTITQSEYWIQGVTFGFRVAW